MFYFGIIYVRSSIQLTKYPSSGYETSIKIVAGWAPINLANCFNTADGAVFCSWELTSKNTERLLASLVVPTVILNCQNQLNIKC